MLNREKKTRFVTLADTLHPETAYNAGNNEAQNQHHVGNDASTVHDRWGVVWAEATLVEGSVDTDNDIKGDQDMEKENSVVVEAVAVDANDQEGLVQLASSDGTNGDSAVISGTTPSSSHFATMGNPFALMIGSILAVTSVSTIFALDLSAAIVYLLACGFYHLCVRMKTCGGSALIPYFLLMPVYCSLMLADSLCLLLSVLIAEVLAGIAWFLTGMFSLGRCDVAMAWHQYVRKLCHMTRWAIRGFHAGWDPDRAAIFPPSRRCDADAGTITNTVE